MTIKDALDRAKLLKQARSKEQPAERVLRADTLPEGRNYELPAPAVEMRRAVSLSLEPLKTVEISEAVGWQHRVIVSDSQRHEAAQADAAYRLVRSKVRQRMQRDNWCSFAVTSPRQADGKTVTALNLALSIARERQRPVYVLDLDMRNPSVCEYLGLQGLRSLTDYFAGDAKPEDVLFQTSVPYFHVAGALEPVKNASEMLAGPRLEELLQHIRLRSPDAIVIIDLPPVNVTDEALVVAPRVDALLLVVSEGKTPRDDLARALGSLSDFSIAGVVINRSSNVHSHYYDRYSA